MSDPKVQEAVRLSLDYAGYAELWGGITPGSIMAVGQQYAIRHELDARLAAGVVVEAHLATDLATPGDIQLLGHALGDAHGRHASWLSAADLTLRLRHGFEAHLR